MTMTYVPSFLDSAFIKKAELSNISRNLNDKNSRELIWKGNEDRVMVLEFKSFLYIFSNMFINKQTIGIDRTTCLKTNN